MKPEELQKLYSDDAARGGYLGDENSNRCLKVASLMAEYRTPKKVLDVGCATGSLLKAFTASHEISGTDISELFLAKARENGYREVCQLDVSSHPLPFPDKSFDVVFCGECIEHVVDTDWVFSEINRALKPRGHFLLTFPNIRTPVSLAMMLLNLPPMYASRYRAGHVRDFTTKTMKLALTNNGFVVNLMRGADFYLPKFGGCCPWLASYLPGWSSCVIARAIKERDAAYSLAAVEKALMS